MRCADCGAQLQQNDEKNPIPSHYNFKRGIIHAELLERLHYDPDSGLFTRLKDTGSPKGKKGVVAGSLKKQGYVDIRFNGQIYKAHRLAWFYHYGEWPDGEIDHINGIKSDNRISNLRAATRAENIRNIGRRNKNRTGFKGVGNAGKKWQARITHNGSKIYLGLFDTPEEAHEAYCKAARNLHGSFANVDNNPGHLKKGAKNG
ncbi:HNH endonuclease [Serratia marcescens]|nr:HNH endonuclease [Serratia marcescens]